MKTLDELDALHAAATAGEWKDHGDESVRWDDPMACGYDSPPPWTRIERQVGSDR